MLRTRASRIASLLPVRAGVYAHRVRVLETGDRLERAELRTHWQARDDQPVRADVEETRLPWARLRIEAGPLRGEEHRVEGDLMGLTREGQELVVVSEDGTGRPLMIENLATGQRFEDDDPHPFRRPGAILGPLSILGAGAMFATFLGIPLFVPWLWMAFELTEGMRGRHQQETVNALLLAYPFVLVALCTALAEIYDRREAERRAERRVRIDAALAGALAQGRAAPRPAGRRDADDRRPSPPAPAPGSSVPT